VRYGPLTGEDPRFTGDGEAVLRPLRHGVAHVRHQDQEGHPAGDDRRRPEGQGHHPRSQDQHRTQL